MGDAAGFGAGSLPIEEVARRAGAAAWAERSLYEVLGDWAGTSAGAAVKVYLDSASQHHAWRAQLFLDRLPSRLVQPGEALPQVVRPGSRGEEASVTVLSALESDAARLGAYCRVVLARTVVKYRQWQRECSPLSDRPFARSLDIALADVISDWQEGCAVLVEVLSGTERGPAGAAVAEAAASSAEVERALLEEGPTSSA